MNMKYEGNRIMTKIQSLLDEREWSIYKLAKESDIAYSSLNSMFLKNTQPTLPTLEKICSGFNITLEEFFAESTPFREKIQYDTEELEIIDIYRSLIKKDQKLLLSYIRGFARKKPL